MQPFFFFLSFFLTHPWQLKKSISEVRKKNKKTKHTQATRIQRHSWKWVQVAMYKSVARRMQPLRALLAPVSACLGNAAVSEIVLVRGGLGEVCFGRCTNTVARQSYEGDEAKKQKAPQGAFTDETGHVCERHLPRGRKCDALSDNH